MKHKENDRTERLQELHVQLQDLLAGYVDGVLDDQDQKLVEAHLAGCKACRDDVMRQELMSHRLNRLPVARMPNELHRRIDLALAQEPVPEVSAEHRSKNRQPGAIFEWLRKRGNTRFVTAGGWGVALILLLVMLIPRLEPVPTGAIPMVRDVLTEYRHFKQATLPVSTQDLAVNPPARWPGSHVLARWKTTIGGAPADAFAVRNGANMVIQFRVNEAVFFHNPRVRQAIANSGIYQFHDKNLKVLGLPLKEGGLLVVGPPQSLPIRKKLEFGEA